MDCRCAKAAILRSALGDLDPGAQTALLEHLAGCPSCAANADTEAETSDALALLRAEAPFEIDVVERVLDAVAPGPPPARDAVPSGLFGWAALAAAGLAVGILVSGAFLAPSLFGVVREAARWAVGAGGFLVRLGGTAAASVASMKPLLVAAWVLLTTLSSLVQKAEPLIRAALIVTVLAILILSTAVIGRDFRARAPVNRR
jgi:hypothetical protein